MARRATIVSFDDARARSRRRDAAPARSHDLASRWRAADGRESAGANRQSGRQTNQAQTEGSRSKRNDRADERSSNHGKSRREQRRHERTKARAEKMFSEQFSATAQTGASAEGAPRAAIYEGKMGAKHRKSTRMQRSSSAAPASAKLNPAGWFSAIPLTERALKVATAVACVLLVCAFLYTPAQQYYQALRDHDRLAAEYSIVETRNEALDAQNDALASDAGMEDAVRKKYGYVKEGEQTAIVTGLSDSTSDASRGSDDIEPAVLSSSVKAPSEWYTPLLDTFFGVE